MAHVRETRRFKVSPVELAIFTAIVLIFMNSLINLFYDWDEIKNQLSSSQVASEDGKRGDRNLAATAPLFSSFEIECDSAAKSAKKKAPGKKGATETEEPQESTEAPKISISGPLCGLSKSAKLSKTEVINRTTNKTATVITDPAKGKFSTDFIQLNPGRNHIQVRFIYQDGKEVAQALIVQKN